MYRRSLTYSIIEGIFWSVMIGFGETYFAPYAISLGASNLQVGLLASLPLCIGSIAQIFTPELVTRFGTRKRLVRSAVLCQILCFPPLLWISTLEIGRPTLLLLCITVYWIFSLSGNSAWQSWMGDLVHEKERGRYFSGRSRWIQLTTFLSVVSAGILLEQRGFVPIFLIAMAGRIFSFLSLGRQEEPPHHMPAEAQFTFWQFVKKMQFNNYGLFVLYTSLTSFAVHIAGPYFILYLLEGLHFSYLEFMLTQAVLVASKSIFLPFWGHNSDHYGSRKLLSLAGYLLPLLPFLWLLTDQLAWILVIQFFAGFVWAGYEICSFNFIFDCTSPERRARCSAYYQLFIGIGTVLGALAGGLLLQYPLIFHNPYFFIFFISGVIRLYLSALLLPKIREMRVVENISYRTLLWRMFLLTRPGTS